MSCKLLEFNANKCRVMLLSRKRLNSIPSRPIYLNGVVLSQVTIYKYLGVTTSHNLSWKPHVISICNKTRRLIDMIYRKFIDIPILSPCSNSILQLLDQIWNMLPQSGIPLTDYRLMRWTEVWSKDVPQILEWELWWPPDKNENSFIKDKTNALSLVQNH